MCVEHVPQSTHLSILSRQQVCRQQVGASAECSKGLSEQRAQLRSYRSARACRESQSAHCEVAIDEEDRLLLAGGQDSWSAGQHLLAGVAVATNRTTFRQLGGLRLKALDGKNGHMLSWNDLVTHCSSIWEFGLVFTC